MDTINLAVDEALLLEAYKVGQHRSLTDTVIAALQAYINDRKVQPPVNGVVDKLVTDRNDDDSGTIYDLHKHAPDIGIEGLPVNLDHEMYGHPKQNDAPSKQDHPQPRSIYEVHKYAIDTGIEDMALNVDHYLYGLDRRDE